MLPRRKPATEDVDRPRWSGHPLGAEGRWMTRPRQPLQSFASSTDAPWVTSDADDGSSTIKVMRLRYAGRCRTCALALPAGTSAEHDRASKTVQCLGCAAAPAPAAQRATMPPESPTSAVEVGTLHNEEPEIVSGMAGASARREYERRSIKREERVRAAHPKIGGFLLAISEEPQSTTAWAVGARGEAVLGKHLDGLASRGVRVLHDRRIPRTKANIDHIAVSSSGVFVIDAKRYSGRPTSQSVGGLFRPRVTFLTVAGRNQTKLVDGVHKQVSLVRDALDGAGYAEVPVRGMLCFIEANWPLIGGSFDIDGVDVLWPKKANEHLLAPGDLDETLMEHVHRSLATAFPAA